MNNQSPITASIVPDDDRLDILLRTFGVQHVQRAEGLVFSWMRRLCQDYNGGYWDYWKTTNGGFFMAPSAAGAVTLSSNMEDVELSSQAGGIVASLFAWGQLCNTTELDEHIELYHAVREFAREHAEGQRILALID
ncbi:antirestriction protein [Burkholderia aenigmatica]|uniref:antirestriction protein n=1 Tax=Burkholderia aenigmatica TaxID=2015348 RepID=UPI002655FB80|nr:antirestriction protein [Burkholderia aenigmatica]MDN7880083.1 antirestriction protein [Burkholderia aenigmatica]